MRKAYYENRDRLISDETDFNIEEEMQYQQMCHYKFESNNAEAAAERTGWLPIIEELNKNK